MTPGMSATETTAPVNPYLTGNFAPVYDEITADDLDVIGELPRDLRGMFVRNGSNPRFAPLGRYHWFDGDGMVHGVTFENGRAAYRNRYVRTRAYDDETRAGRALWRGMTDIPDMSSPRGPLKDTANTDLVFHNGKLIALWWLGGEPYALSVPSLDPCGIENFGGRVRTISAHPKVDLATGELLFFDYKPFPPYLTYGVVSRDGALTHHTVIDLPGPRMQHDLAFTARFTIFMDMSMVWDEALLKKGRTRAVFDREKPTRFGILPRHAPGAEVRWFEASPCFMYHTVNAWEEGDKVVLVGCKIENPLAGDPKNPARDRVIPAIGFLRLEPLLYRWTFDLRDGSVREETLDDTLAEFPKMDVRAMGRRSRYVYSPRFAPTELMLFDGFLKYDTDRQTSVAHDHPAGWYGGELAFAPRENARSEDDGYLVTFVVEEGTGQSELHVFDAQSPERAPVARVKIPQRVPTGYHTWWIPGDDLDAAKVHA